MKEPFNAEEFVRKLRSGGLDARLNQVLLQLSKEELEAVNLLMEETESKTDKS